MLVVFIDTWTHLWITRLVTSEETISYLGSLLSLLSFFDGDDIDYNSSQQLLLRPLNLDSSAMPSEGGYRNKLKLALALKATIGWYHLHDPSSAEKWGEDWFRFELTKVSSFQAARLFSRLG